MSLLQIIVTIIFSILFAMATAKSCISRWGGSFKKLCVIGCLLSAISTGVSILLHGLGMHNIQTIFLACVFLYASFGDIKTHEADDFIHILVWAIALIAKPVMEVPYSMLAAVIMIVLMSLVTLFVPNSGIGGADIKFVGACAFLSALEGSLMGLCFGMFIGLICNPPFRKKEEEAKAFPMLPYLSCSYMLVHLLF